MFVTLPSGRRFSQPSCTTKRFKNASVPSAVRIFNYILSVCVCVWGGGGGRLQVGWLLNCLRNGMKLLHNIFSRVPPHIPGFPHLTNQTSRLSTVQQSRTKYDDRPIKTLTTVQTSRTEAENQPITPPKAVQPVSWLQSQRTSEQQTTCSDPGNRTAIFLQADGLLPFPEVKCFRINHPSLIQSS